jgi:hypothetical protein
MLSALDPEHHIREGIVAFIASFASPRPFSFTELKERLGTVVSGQGDASEAADASETTMESALKDCICEMVASGEL